MIISGERRRAGVGRSDRLDRLRRDLRVQRVTGGAGPELLQFLSVADESGRERPAPDRRGAVVISVRAVIAPIRRVVFQLIVIAGIRLLAVDPAGSVPPGQDERQTYSFLEEYTNKFNEILGEEYTEEEKLFCDCCYYVWYTEYEAKRYEWYSNNSGLLNYLYVGKADRYRKYADTLYDMLISAKSDTDLKNIRIYCVDHKIISE